MHMNVDKTRGKIVSASIPYIYILAELCCRKDIDNLPVPTYYSQMFPDFTGENHFCIDNDHKTVF